jgi:hypothetical protein
MKSILKRLGELAGSLDQVYSDVRDQVIVDAWAKIWEPGIPSGVLKAMRELTYVNGDRVLVTTPYNYLDGEFRGAHGVPLEEALTAWHNTTGYYCCVGKTEIQRCALNRSYVKLAFDKR